MRRALVAGGIAGLLGVAGAGLLSGSQASPSPYYPALAVHAANDGGASGMAHTIACTPGLNCNVSAGVATLTVAGLSENGSNCESDQAAIGVDQYGNAEGCWTPVGVEVDPLSVHIGATPPCPAGYALTGDDAGYRCVRLLEGLPLCGTNTALKNNDAGVTCTSVLTSETDPLSIHVGATPLCAAGEALKNNDGGFSCVKTVTGLPLCPEGNVLKNNDGGVTCVGYVNGVTASCASGYVLTSSDAGLSCIEAVLEEVDPTAVHLTGDESVAGTKDFTEGKTTWTGTASDTTGGELTGGPAKNISTVGRTMIFRGGPGAYDGYNTPTAGGVTYFYGGVGGHGDKSHTGATGGVAYVAGGFGGNGTSETLPGAGADLYVSGGPPGSATANGNVNGSSLHLNPGAPYNAGTNGTVYIGDAYTPTSIELRGPTVIGNGGTAISKSLRYSGTIDVASITAATCRDTSITLTGAATGAECVVGAPAALTNNISATCYVSATNTVQLRTCNGTAGNIDPASGTWAVRVFNP